VRKAILGEVPEPSPSSSPRTCHGHALNGLDAAPRTCHGHALNTFIIAKCRNRRLHHRRRLRVPSTAWTRRPALPRAPPARRGRRVPVREPSGRATLQPRADSNGNNSSRYRSMVRSRCLSLLVHVLDAGQHVVDGAIADFLSVTEMGRCSWGRRR
jgi:hypothetical protein